MAEIWRDCRNVEGGWPCVTEHGEELFIQYAPDYAERFKTGPARVPERCYVERDGERIEVIIERRRATAPGVLGLPPPASRPRARGGLWCVYVGGSERPSRR